LPVSEYADHLPVWIYFVLFCVFSWFQSYNFVKKALKEVTMKLHKQHEKTDFILHPALSAFAGKAMQNK
jgi:hypothetical protein